MAGKKNEFSLNERKNQLLFSAVESYIENALPITSEKVQVNYFSTLSSATLRNELNALEEMGYLKQLHTSGGRIPTTKAYRYYVNSIMENNHLDSKSISKIQKKFQKRSSLLIDLLDDLAKGISEILEYPTVIHLSGYKDLSVIAINIIPLITGEALMLLQTDVGIINNTIKLSKKITEDNCRDASKFLTTNLYNKKISEILENYEYYHNLFKSQLQYFEELFLSLTNMLKQFAEKNTSFIKRGNPDKLLSAPEYKDINSAKKFLTLLENEEGLKEIIQNIEENSDSEVVFSIGDENKDEELNDYSIIKANYSIADGIVASIGVVGPERMDYARIASVLKYITDEIHQEKTHTSTRKKKEKNNRNERKEQKDS